MNFLRGFKLLGVERNGCYGYTSQSTCLYGLDKFCFESSHLAINNYVSQKVHMSQKEGLINVILQRKWHNLFICQVQWHCSSDKNFEELVYMVFFVWSPQTFQHVIVFHISVVMCCSSQIPFDDSAGLPIVALCHYCFALSSLG